ncbi:MAG TPA: hypothetical protein VIJ66_11210 [Solirubrobacteraceae bacterium]
MIAVVHLIWGPLGLDPPRRFLASYNAQPAGAEHELVVVLNGVEDSQRAGLEAELAGVVHRTIELPRPVQDLGAYAQALEHLEHDRICFVNSHSELLTGDWLRKLDLALEEPRAGLVGASGSWASLRSYALRRLGLPSAYGRVWPRGSSAFEEFRRIESERAGAPLPRGLRSYLYTARTLADMTFGFNRFPAPHLRTNAFMGERSLLARLLEAGVRRKFNAYRMESGRGSITAQVLESGLRALVVDSEGSVSDSDGWPDSETFWSGTQRRLLISDNQTRIYQSADPRRRILLAQYAWGDRAPTPSGT